MAIFIDLVYGSLCRSGRQEGHIIFFQRLSDNMNNMVYLNGEKQLKKPVTPTPAPWVIHHSRPLAKLPEKIVTEREVKLLQFLNHYCCN